MTDLDEAEEEFPPCYVCGSTDLPAVTDASGKAWCSHECFWVTHPEEKEADD
jgi:hypothetical protein